MSIESRWFQNLLADRRMSQRGLAKKLGLDPAAVSLMFRGKRRMQMHEAAEVARLLGVTMDEVMEHAGIRAPAGGHVDLLERSVPLVYWMDGSGEMHAVDPGERVEITATMPDDVVACQCRTAMSQIEHMDRWLLFFRAPTSSGVQADAVGRYCVMRLRGGVMTAGYLRPGYKRGTYAVHGPMNLIDATVEWATPIVLIQP
jgi:transcriptional regulator with XRE-family HTH domain